LLLHHKKNIIIMDTNIHLPFVSVIIPVYNDANRLAICLNALDQQSYPRERFEIIVVNNRSTDHICDVISHHTVIYIEENFLIGDAARNSGVQAATGPILAFTDSDCIPSSHWLETGVASLSQNIGVDLIGGLVRVFSEDNSWNTVELFEKLFAFNQKKYINLNGFSVTANMFTYKITFENIGLFSTSLKFGGDCEWGNRLKKAGGRMLYAPETIVSHPARNSFKKHRKKIASVAEGKINLIRSRSGLFSKDICQLMLPPLFSTLRDAITISRSPILRSNFERARILSYLLLFKSIVYWYRIIALCSTIKSRLFLEK